MNLNHSDPGQTDTFGHRLIISTIRQVATETPQRVFALSAKSEDVSSGFHQVTFAQIARAVNYVSNWLQARFENGGKPCQHPTITYMGVPDLRYNIFFYAAIQCRYKVFLPSPRNPSTTNISLLEQTECSKLVYSVEVAPLVNDLQAALPGLFCEQIQSLDELLAAPDTEYTYSYRFSEVSREPVLILHSSGSTGMPKPVMSTHGTFATCDIRDWPTVPGRTNHDFLTTIRFVGLDSYVYDTLPPFHLGGFMLKLIVPVYNLTAPIFGPSIRPPSGAQTAEIIRICRPRAVTLPPSILEQLYHEHNSTEIFRNLDMVVFGGGPLSQSIGDSVSKHTSLCQIYGSTEINQIRQLFPSRDDWQYLEFHPNERFKLDPMGDNTFELVLFANKEVERSTALYHNYPELHEYRTKDLFIPHPYKPNLWRFHARRDDILVFSSGEKLNPIPMESFMATVPGVKGAVVVGRGYPQAGLLLELLPTPTNSSDMSLTLWSAVDQANDLLPAHGRVTKSMVIITQPQKPFKRTTKGTVIRSLTEALYAAEIKKLYEVVLKKPHGQLLAPVFPSFQINDIKVFLRSILSYDGDDLSDDDNIYNHGMDSVRTVEAIGDLKSGLLQYRPEGDLGWVSRDFLYRNPTINRLSSVLLAFLNNDTIPISRDRVIEMKTKIAEFTDNLPHDLKPHVLRSSTDKFSIAITGTTGFLGGYLLAKLTKMPCISRIYCLNRSDKAQEIFGSEASRTTKDIMFFKIDLCKPKLGMSSSDYDQLLRECDVFVHNAWKVDFNLGLDAFQDNLQSVRDLIDLSAASKLRPPIIFISSISSTGIWAPIGSPQQTIPEHLVSDLDIALKTGYGESKQVAEHILNTAATDSGIPVAIIRLGQVAPSSETGNEKRWPEDDMVPIYLRTCKAAKILASDFVEKVDWLPVNQATAVICDVLQHEMSNERMGSVNFYNMVHPQAQSWTSLMSAIRAWCGHETQIVNMHDWIQMIKQMDMSDLDMISRFPALRLLPSFEFRAQHGPVHRYEMKNLLKISKHIAQIPAIDSHLMETWLKKL